MQPSLPFRQSIDARFAAFHRDNPEVYAQFERFALEAIAHGRRKLSADSVMHRVRWEADMTWAKSEGFKVNNDFVSRYARLFRSQYPQHAGFFETRKLKSA